MTLEDAKKAAAQAAMDELPECGTIGLGTGSTARCFIELVAAGVRAGKRWMGVPTSQPSRTMAAALEIPLLDDEGPWSIDVTVDGADEVDPALHLIKGGGAAHTREKIVNSASLRNIIIVDESKLSRRLGTRFRLPIEVLPFAHRQTARLLGRFGEPSLRTTSHGPVRTDSGNLVYDLKCDPIDDAATLEVELDRIPGVVETGLFVGRADVVLVAGVDGAVRRLTRP